jgi:hypothetical protein
MELVLLDHLLSESRGLLRRVRASLTAAISMLLGLSNSAPMGRSPGNVCRAYRGGRWLFPPTLRLSCGRRTDVQPCRWITVEKSEQSRPMREACNHARIYPCGRLPHAAPHVGIVGRDGPARLSPVIAGFLERRNGGSPVKCEVHFARVAVALPASAGSSAIHRAAAEGPAGARPGPMAREWRPGARPGADGAGRSMRRHPPGAAAPVAWPHWRRSVGPRRA